MAYSYVTYTGNGSTTQFTVPFGYIRREHVLATVAAVSATFTWVNNGLIQMTTAPANGAAVRVYRVTPLESPLVDFADGATLVAADLDTNARQSIYTQQELDDSLVGVALGAIPNGDKGDIVTSVGGTVWTIDTGAVVEAKIGTGAVVEAKIGTGAVSAAKIAAGAFTNSVSSTSTTTIATPSSVKTSYDLATTANTTANAALPKAGGTMTGVITYAAAQPRLVQGTAVATTSGTSVDFTGIPSWAKRITVMLDGVSTNGTSPVQIQLGDSGGIETTGYVGTGTAFIPPNVVGVVAYTTGFVPLGATATASRTGCLFISNITANAWIAIGIFDDQATQAGFSQGSKSLSATLDRVRLTTVNGTDTFDAGTVNIMYEG